MATTKTTSWQRTDEPRDRHFAADELINAYIKGVKEGNEQIQKAISKQLEENLEKAGKHTSHVMTILQDRGFEFYSALLKIHNWDEVEVIILVNSDQYTDPKFIEIYDLITGFEEEIKEDTYSITFSFTDYDDSLDMEKMESDGFILEYNMNQE
ncbi:MAG: hypothetical protein R6V23_06615 [Bacteroidales bacterium]